MVRAHVKHPAEKKAIAPKKAVNKARRPQSSVWPCKINGCNKEFAREADLKRHQRTTKMHMLPTSQPVLCPQCDATFTRTDALRRHQKSRHNGVIIDPIDSSRSKGTAKDAEGSTASAQRSRSNSPSLKDWANGKQSTVHTSTSAAVHATVGRANMTNTPSGPQSYYRQNNFSPIFVPPRTPNGVLDPSSYQATQIPTSAARFHTWIPNPPWIQENPSMPRPPNSGPITFVQAPQAGYYTPGSYYRTSNGQPAMPVHIPHGVIAVPVNSNSPLQQPANPNGSGNSPTVPSAPSTQAAGNIDPSLGTSSVEDSGKVREVDKKPETDAFADAGLSAEVQKALRAVLAIDPSLNGSLATAAVSETRDTGSRSRPSDASLSEAKEHTDEQQLHDPREFDENGAVDMEDQDVGANLDATVDADNDENGPFQQNQHGASSADSETTLPAGIKELINEDSLSYAAPS